MGSGVNKVPDDIMRQAQHQHEKDGRPQWLYLILIGLAAVATLVGSVVSMWRP